MKMTINTRVIQHLGKDLITSPDVAIVELIKNSIDAKAKNISLKLYDMVSMTNSIPKEALAWIDSNLLEKPVLVVEDDGKGMTDEVIQNGFLDVGTRIKEKEETLLGEKGIGRLATQRLGCAVLLETCSMEEDHTSYVYINWDKVISGQNDVPYIATEKMKSHTRLWIFDVNVEDYIENAVQFQQQTIFEDQYVAYPNKDMKTAISFLISPFDYKEKKEIKIKVYYRDREIDCGFQSDMISLAESCHTFSIVNLHGEISMECGIVLKPWYAERIHRSLVKATAFSRLKRPHEYYRELLEKNKLRLAEALTMKYAQEDLVYHLKAMLESVIPPFGKTDDEQEQYYDYLTKQAEQIVTNLAAIIPLSGAVYSFKQDYAIGQNIVIAAAAELGTVREELTHKDIKRFLDDNNGVKLYRGKYRIGFLGNKENDWIKLQQFRTKGQQWYRFDLGNTVGFVSLTDTDQTRIQEISSRLDISRNEYSDALKACINLVFNYFFYDLNRKANSIVKILLEEDGQLGDSIPKKVKKNEDMLRRMQANNRKLLKHVDELTAFLNQEVEIGEKQASLSIKAYEKVTKSISKINSDVTTQQEIQNEAKVVVKEASEQLHSIEIEAYNNFKLMANGMITETITHELDSIRKTGISPDDEKHFDALRQYFEEAKEARVYNQHLYPIRSNYKVLASRLQQVGSMYSFLETTFIHKGAYDAFELLNLETLIKAIKDNLMASSSVRNVVLISNLNELTWLVPKGVMLHVFYNLFSNSLYWIDIRRKWAQNDKKYYREENDEIRVDVLSENEIIISDTGTGVIRSMEDLLFEPLESGKEKEERRGMGLYIVQKLMRSFGGDVELLDDRNEYGHRYRFLLTLKAQGE